MDTTQNITQKITPFLWFKEDAEAVMTHYASIFKEAQTGQVTRFGGNVDGKQEGFSTGTLRLLGQEFIIFSGPATFELNAATSFCISCQNQQEIDYYWEKLSEGGQEGQCGWLTDRFGLSWQVLPSNMGTLLHGPDKAGCEKAMQAMLQMGKLNVSELELAYYG